MAPTALPFSLTSFKELEPLLFNKLEKQNASKRRQRLESRFWEPSGDTSARPPIEVSHGTWSVGKRARVQFEESKETDSSVESSDEIVLASIPDILRDHICIEELEAAFDVWESKLMTEEELSSDVIKIEFASLEQKACR